MERREIDEMKIQEQSRSEWTAVGTKGMVIKREKTIRQRAKDTRPGNETTGPREERDQREAGLLFF